MYDFITKLNLVDALALPHDVVVAHQGDRRQLVRRHQRQVEQAFDRHGPQAVGLLAPRLLHRILDTRTLRTAVDHLTRFGGRTPGPNGLCLHDLHDDERWNFCRALLRSLQAGTYRPGPELRIKIPKPHRPGQFRTIVVQNAEDRVVARSVASILQPIAERLFSSRSFGFRSRCGRLQALATALHLSQAEQRWHWVTADIANAFDRVPLNRCMDAVGIWFPDEVIELVRIVADTGQRRGLRQGSPLSPLLLNIFLDHFLDRPWQKSHPDIPLIRYADDILLLCRSADEANTAYRDLTRQLIVAGTPLKPAPGSSALVRPTPQCGGCPTVDLMRGGAVEWLGFNMKLTGDQLTARLGRAAWRSLEQHLADLHLRDDAPLHADAVLRGWLEQAAPTFAFENSARVVERARDLAVAQSFAEVASIKALRRRWSAAHARWCRLRDGVAASLTHGAEDAAEAQASAR